MKITSRSCNSGTRICWEYPPADLVQDAIDQGYFRESLAPQAQLKTQTIAYTFKELASGLKALHDKDILHCDISGGVSAS